MNKPPARIRSTLAFRMARVDRQKFNEAVSAGAYRCAPPTIQGTARVFEMNDLIGLFIFGRLLDRGFLPKMAGSLACGFLEELKSKEHTETNTDKIWFVEGLGPSTGVFMAGGMYDPDHEAKGRQYTVPGRVGFEFSVNIAYIRQFLENEIETERNTFGREDDE